MDRFITSLNNEDALLYDVCQIKREGKAREYNDYCPTLCNGSWKNPQVGRIYSTDGCSPTLNTCGGGSHEPKILQVGRINSSQDGVVVSEEGVSPTHTAGHGNMPKVLRVGNVNPSGRGMNGNVFSDEGLAPTLTTNKGEGNKIATRHVNVSNVEPKERFFKQAIDTFENSDAKYGDTIDAFNERVNKSGCSPTLTTRPEGFKTAILPVTNNLRIRKLTPKECFRLMGFSDEHYQAAKDVGVSNSQLYKQTGNSIVVDVLYYILVELYKAMPYLFDDLRLSSFFSGIGAFEIALNRLYESINTGNFTSPQVE